MAASHPATLSLLVDVKNEQKSEAMPPAGEMADPFTDMTVEEIEAKISEF